MLGDRNRRQFIEMKRQINLLIRNNSLISNVVGNLTFLRNSIDNIDESWECEFNEQILNLESLSCGTENQIREMGDLYHQILNSSVTVLDSLISKAINSCETSF